MAMRFFDVTDVDSDYLRFIFKHYGLDVDKLLYHNEYYSMDDINDIVKFDKYERTFRVYIVLDGDDLSLFNTYRSISIEDFSDVRNKINTFNSVLSGYYLETRIKDIEEYLNKCVISTVIIGD